MFKFTLLVHIIVMPTLMGLACIAVLVADPSTGARELIIASVAGFFLSIPVSYVVARRIRALTRG